MRRDSVLALMDTSVFFSAPVMGGLHNENQRLVMVERCPNLFYTDGLKSRCIGNPRDIPERPPHFLLTVVIDLDETLMTLTQCESFVVIRRGALNLIHQLSTLRMPVSHPESTEETLRIQEDAPRACEVIIWSAGAKEHVDRCVGLIDPAENLIDYVICRDASWYNFGDNVNKDISLLRGRGSSAILVDDCIHACVKSLMQVLLVPPFKPCSHFMQDCLYQINEIITFLLIVLAADRIDRAEDACQCVIDMIKSSDAKSRDVKRTCKQPTDSKCSQLPPHLAAMRTARILRLIRDSENGEKLISSNAKNVVGPHLESDHLSCGIYAVNEADLLDREAVLTAAIIAKTLRAENSHVPPDTRNTTLIGFASIYDRTVEKGGKLYSPITSVMSLHPLVVERSVNICTWLEPVEALMLCIDDDTYIKSRLKALYTKFTDVDYKET